MQRRSSIVLFSVVILIVSVAMPPQAWARGAGELSEPEPGYGAVVFRTGSYEGSRAEYTRSVHYRNLNTGERHTLRFPARERLVVEELPAGEYEFESADRMRAGRVDERDERHSAVYYGVDFTVDEATVTPLPIMVYYFDTGLERDFARREPVPDEIDELTSIRLLRVTDDSVQTIYLRLDARLERDLMDELADEAGESALNWRYAPLYDENEPYWAGNRPEQPPVALQDEVADESRFADTPESPHSWSRRALSNRYKADVRGIAPPYHAGMLAFLPGRAAYLGGGGHRGEDPRPEIPPVTDRYSTSHVVFPEAGWVVRAQERLGLGFDAAHHNYVVDYGNDSFYSFTAVIGASAGVRLTENVALGGTLGLSATTYELEQAGATEQELFDDYVMDGLWSLGVAWRHANRDVWAGVRVVRDLLQERPYYYLEPRDEFSEFELLRTPQPTRTEGFLRAGVLNDRLMLSFDGALEWTGGNAFDTEEGDGRIEGAVIFRDLGLEYRVAEPFWVRLVYHQQDTLFNANEVSYFAVAPGGSVGVAYRIGSFLIDVTGTYRSEGLDTALYVDERISFPQIRLQLTWEEEP